MSLSRSQYQQLQKALLSAFPARADLKQMVFFALDKNLDEITVKDNITDIVFDLIGWAEARGRTSELIHGAYDANDGNPALKAFVEDFGMEAPGESDSSKSKPTEVDQTGTDGVGGDHISIGDISNANGIAIGTGAQVNITNNYSDAPRPDDSAVEESTRDEPPATPTASTQTQMGARPPKAWVLVVGTGSRWRKLGSEKLIETSKAVGKELAHGGYGLITGGWPGVDNITARSFAHEFTSAGSDLENHLKVVVVDGNHPSFNAGTPVYVHSGDEEWTKPVENANILVLIGGAGGVKKTAEIALRLERVVLPLADTEGDAEDIYWQMQHVWPATGMAGIDLSRFRAMAREAPQVAEELIELLDEWVESKPGEK